MGIRAATHPFDPKAAISVGQRSPVPLTGSFEGLKGTGTLHIKTANPPDRIFIVDGQMAPQAN